MKFIYLLFCLTLNTVCLAQDESEFLEKINISDTILQKRMLIIPGPFDGQKALLKLFPGKYYNLSNKDYKNELINWECKTCPVIPYVDINEDGNTSFPFTEGVATRLMNVMDFTDSTGIQYKVISFSHSLFDADGLRTSRFTGGLLGMAKFVLTKDGWKLRIFDPFIRAYGAFSSCPTPKPLLIGEDQYAFMIKHLNGPGGGPFYGAYFLIAGINGNYSEQMAAYNIEKTKTDEKVFSSWTSEYTVPASSKKYFRDIIVTIKGNYKKNDPDGIPDEFLKNMKTDKLGNFTIKQRYIYKAKKGYELQQPTQ